MSDKTINRTIELQNLTAGYDILQEISIYNPPRKLFFIPYRVNYTHFKIKIDYGDLPDELKISKEKFLQLECFVGKSDEDKKHIISNEIQDIDISMNDFPLNIIMNQDAIRDYMGNEAAVSIKFFVNSYYGENTESQTLEFLLLLNFKRTDAIYSMKFELNQEFRDGKEYSYSNKELLGVLCFRNEAKHTFANPVSFKDIKADLPFIKINIDYNNQDNPIDSTTNTDLNNLLPEHGDVKIPVFIDLTKVPNPKDISKYKVTFTISVYENNKNFTKNYTEQIALKFNPSITAIYSYLLVKSKKIESDNFAIKDSIIWKKGETGTKPVFSFVIENLAKHDNGKVLIKDFSLSFKQVNEKQEPIMVVTTPGEEFPHYLDHENEHSNICRIFKIEPFTIKNSKNLYNSIIFDIINNSDLVRFDISIDETGIQDIPDFKADICCEIKYNYTIISDFIKEAERDVPKQYDIYFSIEKYRGPEWLSIDFGTSAIVGSFLSDTKSINLIDLQKSLAELYKHEYKDQNFNIYDDPGNIPEAGTQFLCSTIMLNSSTQPAAKLYADKFFENIFKISPPLDLMTKAPKLIIPYLKSLVGQNELPLNSEAAKLKYFDQFNKLRTFSENPISVGQILQNVYKSFITHFILEPSGSPIRKKEDLNKIVIAVPNNYTPRHEDFIKKTLKDVKYKGRKLFTDEYIEFISESDAVACFFVTNRQSLMNDQHLKKEEYVLAYDMGAGTLDLTYFKITLKSDGHSKYQEPEILSKIGKTSAGNYLDYLIAEEVVKQLEGQSNFQWNLDSFLTDKSLVFKRFLLKEAVKNKIKPELFAWTEETIKKNTSYKEAIAKILNLLQMSPLDSKNDYLHIFTLIQIKFITLEEYSHETVKINKILDDLHLDIIDERAIKRIERICQEINCIEHDKIGFFDKYSYAYTEEDFKFLKGKDYPESTLKKLEPLLEKEKQNLPADHFVKEVKKLFNDFEYRQYGHDIFTQCEKPFANANYLFKGEIEIDLPNLRKTSSIKKYITQNSTELFKHFFSLSGFKKNDDGKIPLDVIIFTGRGSQIVTLREKITEFLKSTTYLTEGHDNLTIKENLDGDFLKKIVVLGANAYAMAFRSSKGEVRLKSNFKNIFAYFGLIYLSAMGNQWRYVECLSPDEENPYDPEYRTVNLSSATECHFIQSFTRDVEKELNINKSEDYITKMYSFHRDQHFTNVESAAEAKVRIYLDDKQEMIIEIKDVFKNDPTSPFKIDIRNDENYKKSMWPFI